MDAVMKMCNWHLLKRIRISIFNKIVLLYSILIVGTVSILVAIIIVSLSALLRDQAMNYTDQVTRAVASYFHSQCVNYKNMQECLYSKPYLQYAVSDDLIPLLQESQRGMSSEYADRYNNVDKYFRSMVMPSDDDIEDAFLLNKDMDWNMQFSRDTEQKNIAFRYAFIQEQLQRNHDVSTDGSKKLRIIPEFSCGKNQFFAIYDCIRSLDSSNYAGYLVYTFSIECIKHSYAQFNDYLLGSILIIDPGGDVIFDSSGKSYGTKFPAHEKMSGHPSGSFTQNGSIVNYTQDSSFDFITVGVIPKNAIYQRVNILNAKIVVAAAVCILCAIFMTCLLTRRFSRRIHNVVDTIQEIQKGDLTARAKEGNSGDEIQLIAHNLNIMSERIDNHIKKEYTYELRQKDAMLKQKTDQLYAMQLQINPHFLYNTLEVIRMTALGAGDAGAEKMTMLLAKMLRSSTKGGMFLSVREELQNCESYLELIRIRFGGRLQVSYRIDPRIMSYAIPKNMMQPIIENSIVHGGKTNHIAIEGVYTEGSIIITVSDNGEGISESALSEINTQLKMPYNLKDNRIGIFNVNSRIKLIFGDKYGIRLESKPGMGTKSIVTFAAKKAKELSNFPEC